MPKVSIIIPVYNVEKYIKRCLDSVCNQTLKDIEIIIVNDNSKDNSYDICKEYQNKDKRIRLYSKENEGLGFTRNYGMTRATGEYIAFLDSDDYVDLNFYEQLYLTASEKKSDVCFAETKIHYNKKNIDQDLKEEIIPRDIEIELTAKEVFYSMLRKKNKYNFFVGMSVWKSIYKREIIEKYNISFLSERIILSEDIFFNFDFLERIESKPAFCPDIYYYYCINENSLTNTYRADRFEKAKIMRKTLIEKAKSYKEYECLENYIDSFFIGYVRNAIKQEVCYTNKESIKSRIIAIITDPDVKRVLNKKYEKTTSQNIFDLCMKRKLITLLIFFSKMKNK